MKVKYYILLLNFPFLSQLYLTCNLSCFSGPYKLQARNKPIEPPKKPQKAPFFLPSVPSLSGEILFEPSKLSEKENDGTGDGSDINTRSLDVLPSPFVHLLQSSAEEDNCKHPNNLFHFCIVYYYCVL